MRSNACLRALALCAAAISPVLASQGRCEIGTTWKPRLFLLTDIANEPDDAQSLVRLLAYANEFDWQGLIATTSVWLNHTTRPDQIHDIVDAYGEVVPNLQKQAAGWPTAAHLKSLVASGLPAYGMDGVGEGKDSDGSSMLVKAVDASEEPLWVSVWGGASVLAQALWAVNASRSQLEIDRFVSKLRVYAISDQDNSGTWIRRHWPHLWYIASVHHFNRYAVAGWTAMSEDTFYHFPTAANRDVVSHAWFRKNVQDVGPLGAKYPEAEFIFEGDTPALLYYIPNGLSDPQYPEWGSWGGRYGPVTWGEGHFADSVDTIEYDDGRVFQGPHVTIWRWRDAVQADFAARMQWTVESDFKSARHPPVVAVNGNVGRDIIRMTVKAGEEIVLDAGNSCNPDGSRLSYKWWQYKEPSSRRNHPLKDVAVLQIQAPDEAKTTVTIPPNEELRKNHRKLEPFVDKHLHLILEVSNGDLVSYRRVVFTILGPESLAAQGNERDEL